MMLIWNVRPNVSGLKSNIYILCLLCANTWLASYSFISVVASGPCCSYTYGLGIKNIYKSCNTRVLSLIKLVDWYCKTGVVSHLNVEENA